MITSFYKLPVIALFAVFYCSGCSQDLLSKEDSKSSDQEAEDVKEDEPANQPVEVSGAFITILCASDGFKIDKVSAPNNVVVSCVIKNADGSRYTLPITSITSQLFASGRAVTAQTELSSGPPWHFHVDTTPEDRTKLSSGSFEILTGDKTEKVETTVFDYKWHKDPLFALLVIGLTATPNPEKVAETMVALEKIHGQNVQFAFVSDDIFPGSIGVENADAYCDREGKKVLADRSWKALMSSPTQTVRERIQIKHPVLNLFGQWVSSVEKDKTPEEQFWTQNHITGFRTTQTGKDTHLYEEYNSRLQVVDFVWTGFDYTGAKDTELGDCNNWTSSEPSLTGGVADSRDNSARWAKYYKMSCDSQARIICINP